MAVSDRNSLLSRRRLYVTKNVCVFVSLCSMAVIFTVTDD